MPYILPQVMQICSNNTSSAKFLGHRAGPALCFSGPLGKVDKKAPQERITRYISIYMPTFTLYAYYDRKCMFELGHRCTLYLHYPFSVRFAALAGIHARMS
jgi:hypothetical protein